MKGKILFSLEEKEYWINVCIAWSQITFGLLWATIFLPIDRYKAIVIVLNIIATTFLIVAGLYLTKKRK